MGVEIKKVRVILQSRLSSRRLAGKALLTIAGIPIVILAAKRLISKQFQVIIATSTDSSDDSIVREAIRNEIPFFRGSLNDVLDRYTKCVEDLIDSDLCIRVTADNVLPNYEFLEDLLYKKNKYNYEYLSGSFASGGKLPFGLEAEIFSVKSLREANYETTDEYDREHVTPFIIRKHKPSSLINSDENTRDLSHLRCTIDNFDDYCRILKLFDGIEDPVSISWQELVSRLEKIY